MNNLKNISEEQLNAIDRYLDNEITAAERLEIDTKLNDDPIFKSLVDDVREMRLGIESAILKDQLNDFHEEMVPVKRLDVKSNTLNNKSSLRRLMTYSIAASIVAAIGIFMFMNQGSANEKLFTKHFNADPGLPTVMGNTENYTFNEAMVDYKLKNYDKAIEKWESQRSQKPDNDTLNYFIGVAKMAAGNTPDAIVFLQKTLVNGESVFTQDANLYLGLAYLKEGNTAAAKYALSKSNLPEAQKVLDEINN